MLLLLAAWELYCFLNVLVPLTARRQLRQRYRLRVDGRARIDGRSTILEVLDISTTGVALLAPVEVKPGVGMRLLTRLADASGAVHDVTLPVVVQSCHPMSRDTTTGPMFHLGTQFHGLDDDDRRRVLEYCAVAHPAGALRNGELDPALVDAADANADEPAQVAWRA
jgi:hypothetical protein